MLLVFCVSGGRYLEVGDERCTHMVVEENSVKELPLSPKKLYVVKQEVGIVFGSFQCCLKKTRTFDPPDTGQAPSGHNRITVLLQEDTDAMGTRVK